MVYAAKVGSLADEHVHDDARAIYLMDHPDSTEEIPTIDIADYLAGKPGAREKVAAELRHVTETIGFFYLAGHGVPQRRMDRMFEEARRFFDLPLETKKEIKKIRNGGYAAPSSYTGNGRLIDGIKPNLYESLSINRELAPDDPDVVAGKPLRTLNQWPRDLPGFREEMLLYHGTITALGVRMLDLWNAALDLPRGHLEQFFQKPRVTMAITHYPPQPPEMVGQRQYGLSPHTDNAFMTILAHGNVPGLAVRMPSGHWRAVEIKPGTFIVNTGDIMVRWTNGRFLSTKHRVINLSGAERYVFPVFISPDLEAPIECLPSCQGPGNPAKYPPTTCEEICLAYFKE